MYLAKEEPVKHHKTFYHMRQRRKEKEKDGDGSEKPIPQIKKRNTITLMIHLLPKLLKAYL